MENLPTGIWVSAFSSKRRQGAGLFLDRDGFVVREVNYLYRIEVVVLGAWAKDIIDAALRAGLAVITVANLAGIDRVYFGWEEYEAVEQEIMRQLGPVGSEIDLNIACAYHPDVTPNYSSFHAAWRKPGPRVLEYVADQLSVNLAKAG